MLANTKALQNGAGNVTQKQNIRNIVAVQVVVRAYTYTVHAILHVGCARTVICTMLLKFMVDVLVVETLDKTILLKITILLVISMSMNNV